MDPALLPPTLLAQIDALVKQYWQELGTAPHRLGEREPALRALSQQISEAVLLEHARADDQALTPERCECGGVPHVHDTCERTVITLVGCIKLERRYYQCRSCGRRHFPLDQAWQLSDESHLSPQAKATMDDLMAALPSREAHHWWTRLGLPTVSHTTMWRESQRTGAKLQAEVEAQEQAQASYEGVAQYQQALRGPGRCEPHVLEADGVLIRVRPEESDEEKFREVRVGLIARLNEYQEWEPQAVRYVAGFQPAEVFRRCLVRAGLEEGVTRQTPLALISDGAQWIAWIAEHAYKQAVVIRDWYHTMGYVWKAAKALYGESQEAVQALVRTLGAQLWEGEVQAARETLASAALMQPPSTPDATTAYRETQVYLENQGYAMKYATYREAGWPIGSGAVESECKTLVEARMKRAGMIWSPVGAAHLLLLRARYFNKLAASPSPPM